MADSTRQPAALVDADERPGSALAGHRFADSIADFAAHLQPALTDPVELAALVVEAAVKFVPGADHAAVRRPSAVRYLETAAVDECELPRQLLELQNTLGEGPCLDAVQTGAQIWVTDVSTDVRWPRFSPTAAGLGVVGALSTPMQVHDHATGCLALVSTSTGFDEDAASLARIFALHAGSALSGALRHESLTAALASRGVIGQAKGILMERFKVTEAEAFAVLVKISANQNVKLRTVAEELCRTGLLEVAPPRRRSPAAGPRTGISR